MTLAPVEVPRHDVEVIPVGRLLSLRTWTPDMVRDAVLPDVPTDIVCWQCCHGFSWRPCRVPVFRDDRDKMEAAVTTTTGRRELPSRQRPVSHPQVRRRTAAPLATAAHGPGRTAGGEPSPPKRRLYYSDGVFCTWNCAKAHVLQNRTSRSCGVTEIALLANLGRRLPPGEQASLRNGVFLAIPPPRRRLRMFGGDMTVEEYRKGSVRFDGGVCGDADDFLGTLLPRNVSRKDYEPPAFIDKSIVTMVRCNTAGGVIVRPSDAGFNIKSRPGRTAPKGASVPAAAAPVAANMSIKEKMEESRKRRAAPAVGKGGCRTLDETMGIKFKRVERG